MSAFGITIKYVFSAAKNKNEENNISYGYLKCKHPIMAHHNYDWLQFFVAAVEK